MADDIILRRIFPKKSKCSECGGTDYLPNGNSRHGTILYRQCQNTKCRAIYRVLPIAVEVDRGGLVSEVKPW